MGPQVGRTASKVLFKRLTGVSPIISKKYFDDFVESDAILFTYNSSSSCSQNLWPEFSFFLRHSEHVHCLKVFKSLKHGNVYTSPSPMSKVTGKGNLDFGLSLKSYGPPNQNRFRGFLWPECTNVISYQEINERFWAKKKSSRLSGCNFKIWKEKQELH